MLFFLFVTFLFSWWVLHNSLRLNWLWRFFFSWRILYWHNLFIFRNTYFFLVDQVPCMLSSHFFQSYLALPPAFLSFPSKPQYFLSFSTFPDLFPSLCILFQSTKDTLHTQSQV